MMRYCPALLEGQGKRRFSFGPVQAVLVAICATGALALPFGDPRLIIVAIPVEILFAALVVLTTRYRKALFACLPLAVIVIIGNSLAPPHVQIMTTFSKPLNAVLLITGGYVLQVALIAAVVITLKKHNKQLKHGDSEKQSSGSTHNQL